MSDRYDKIILISCSFTFIMHLMRTSLRHVLYLRSSEATRLRAKVLSDQIGSYHIDMKIDTVISALISLFQTLTGRRPCYKVLI